MNENFWTRKRQKKLHELTTAGYTAQHIADRIGDGCTRNMVIGMWARGTREEFRVKLPPEDVVYLTEMAKQRGCGLTVTALIASIVREVIADDRAAEGRS